jgi:hypothetical protein
MLLWTACAAALLLLQVPAHGASLQDIFANAESVEVVPTLQLLQAVPQRLEQQHSPAAGVAAGNINVHVRMHQVEDDWWSPKLYSSSLASLVVRARRDGGGGSMRACILMADSRQSLLDGSGGRHAQLARAGGTQEMYLLPAVINLVTALQARHDFVHFRLPLKYPGRYSAWLKLVALRAIVPRYDYVLYLDSDTFVRQPARPALIHAMAREGGLDRGNVLALTRESPQFPDVANTGILLFRSGSTALALLDEWWGSLARHRRLQHYRQAWSFEQGPFTHVVYPRYNASIALLDFERYNSPEGAHIRHVYSLLSNAEREAIFLEAGAAMLRQVEGGGHDVGGADEEVAACQRLLMLVNSKLLGRLEAQ